MNIGEISDFLAGLFIQYGNYLKIKKEPMGWFFSMAAILYWIIRAKYTGFASQSFWHIFSFIMASYGYWKWKKENG